MHLLDYVALATVADVVPLIGENRILVRHGPAPEPKPLAGLRALIETSGLGGAELRAGQVGFILAPRLNAAGGSARPRTGCDCSSPTTPTRR